VAKSNVERQREYRLKAKGTYRKLETMLPCNEFDLLHANAKQAGKTKAQYIVGLLHGNDAPESEHQDQVTIQKLQDRIRYLEGRNPELPAAPVAMSAEALRRRLLDAEKKEAAEASSAKAREEQAAKDDQGRIRHDQARQAFHTGATKRYGEAEIVQAAL